MARIRIEIHEADAANYRVDWIEPDGRRESGTFAKADVQWQPPGGAAPLGPGELANYVATSKPEQRSKPEFQEIAHKLFDWLMPAGPVRQRWEQLCLTPRFEIVLDIQVDALKQLQFEMAVGPLPESFQVESLSRHHTRRGVPQIASAWPLRILYVIGCSEYEADELGVYDELKQIRQVFRPLGRSVDIQILERPTKQTLMNWVRENHPHVLHFAGHGGYLPGDMGAFLHFRNKDEPWQWTTKSIAADLFAWRWFPSFVFLNACRTGAYAKVAWSMQQAFMAAGARAALAMQADIKGRMAGEFAANVYRNCAQGWTIQKAVDEGRKVLDLPNGFERWLPVLAAAEPDIVLFQPQPRPALAPFDECDEFESVRCFVDCVEGRRALTHWFHPVVTPEPPARMKHVAVIQGPPQSGKSHLVKWCMESWVLLEAEVRYVLINKGETRNWLSILRQIRDGDAGKGGLKAELLHSALPELAFRPFNWHLRNYLEHGKTEPWDAAIHGQAPIRDDITLELTARGEHRLEEPIIGHFLEALRSASHAKPLVLVFDNLTDNDATRVFSVDDFRELDRYLVRPIMNADQSNIKLIFVVNEQRTSYFEMHRWPDDRVLKLPICAEFSPEQLAELASEIVSPEIIPALRPPPNKGYENNPIDQREQSELMDKFAETIQAVTLSTLKWPTPDTKPNLGLLRRIYALFDGVIRSVGRMK